MTDALGTTTNVYDNLSRLRQVRDAAGLQSALSYDLGDRVTSSIDANGVTTTMTYDRLGRTLTRQPSGGGTESWGYTANVSSATSYTNQVGNITRDTYDPVGRKIEEIIVGVITNTFVYDPVGNLTDLYDGRTNRTQWRYDLYGRVVGKRYAGMAFDQLTYGYGVLSRLLTRTNWLTASTSERTAYTYDVNGNLTFIDYPSGTTDITFTYDPLNRATNMVDAVGTTRWAYANALLVSEDGPWANDTVSYGYNAARLRSSLTHQQPAGTWSQTYGYDAARRLSSVVSPAGTFGYQYPLAGSLVGRISLPGGAYITNQFDTLARIANTELRSSTNVALNRHGYLYDGAHRRTWISRTNSSNPSWNGWMTNTYDAAGELLTGLMRNGAGAAITGEQFTYGYDAGWNLTNRSTGSGSTAFPVNALNQITTSSGSSFTYDTKGNLTSRQPGGGSVYAVSYTYDAENQLRDVASDTSVTAIGSRFRTEFVYDGKMRLRIRREYTWGQGWNLNTETRYLYDGMQIIGERTSAGTPMAAYTRGSDLSGSLEGAGGIGGLLARSTGYVSASGAWGTTNLYHADGNGNVTAMVSPAQALTAGYRYDPFGRTLGSVGAQASANPMRFSSKPLLVDRASESLSLYYYGYRFYEPQIQRWLNRDPLGDRAFLQSVILRRYVPGFVIERSDEGANLFRFARNTPVIVLDPFGLSCGAENNIWGGDWMIPDRPFGFDFGAACENHDNCYSRCGASKQECDSNFFKDMKNQCGRPTFGNITGFTVCTVLAAIYYDQVSENGDGPFNDAQKNCRPWCDPNDTTPVPPWIGPPGDFY
jgi:RHS repeat-associated protein